MDFQHDKFLPGEHLPCLYRPDKYVLLKHLVYFLNLHICPGLPHRIDVECDLWPEISYGGTADGYRGLNVTVVQNQQELDKIEKVLFFLFKFQSGLFLIRNYLKILHCIVVSL